MFHFFNHENPDSGTGPAELELSKPKTSLADPESYRDVLAFPYACAKII